MSERDYDVVDLLRAYLGHARYGSMQNELGHYHRTLYSALRAAFGVDVERELPVDASIAHRIVHALLLESPRRRIEASTPFDTMLEAPADVVGLMSRHAQRLSELRDATRDELVAGRRTAFVVLHGERPPIPERELAVHGFDGSGEPDPIDFCE